MVLSKNTVLCVGVIVLGLLFGLGVYMYGKARADKAFAECEKAHAIQAAEQQQAQSDAISTVITMPTSEKRKTLAKWVK